MAEPPRFSTRRSFLFASVLVLGFFIVLELILRVVGVAKPVRPQILLRKIDVDITFPFMQPDRELFWSLRPGFRGEFEGKPVAINSLGLRGAEVKAPRDPGRRRIVCFGDSITFGYGVGDEETYAFRLAEAFGGRVDVVNAGVTGYTSHQVLAWLRRVVPVVTPDSPEPTGRGGSPEPSATGVGPRRIERDDAPRHEPDVVTLCIGWNDASLRPVDDRAYARSLRLALGVESLADRLYLYRGAKNLYLGYATRDWQAPVRGPRVSLPHYRQNLEAIVEACRARGVKPVFVDLPRRRKAGEAHFNSPYSVELRAVARDRAVPVLDLGDVGLDTLLPSNESYFIDTLHFSREGNAYVGERLLRELIEKKVL